jgi:hypothetical protein
MSQTLAAALTAVLPKLAPRDVAFAQSLLKSATGKRGASDKQAHWMQALVDRVHNPQPEAAPAATVSVSGIITLLQGATAHLKYPKVRLMTESGQKVVLGIAGEKSRYAGDVMVTDGGPFGQNVYFGRITQAGDVLASKAFTDEVRDLLVAFAADPAGVSAVIGKRYGHCCFCARELETRESLAVGYGPICAEKFALPWGEVPTGFSCARLSPDELAGVTA